MDIKELKEALMLFCKTEAYGACDIKQWIDIHGRVSKPRDTDEQIEARVDYFIDTYFKPLNV